MTSLSETAGRLLAEHREAGTAEAERARAAVTGHLESPGYRVTAQRFRFHPSALLGFPILGAGIGGAALLALPLLHLPAVPPWGALAVWVTVLSASVCLAVSVAAGWLQFGEAREDANLIAVRSDVPVRRWIVAHLDTKAQVQSMAGRLVAVWVLAAAVAVDGGLAAARLSGPVPLALGAIGAGLAVLAGALAGRGRQRGTSRGARDNGTGVVAALAFADANTDPASGILITGAEEFGLVGARVYAGVQESLAEVQVVNLDTIDQEGRLYVVTHDRRGASSAARVTAQLAAAGLPARSRRLPVGILVDSLPLARAGASALTIGRLNWRTLRIIHTSADRPEGLSLEMAERVGRAIAAS